MSLNVGCALTVERFDKSTECQISFVTWTPVLFPVMLTHIAPAKMHLLKPSAANIC